MQNLVICFGEHKSLNQNSHISSVKSSCFKCFINRNFEKISDNLNQFLITVADILIDKYFSFMALWQFRIRFFMQTVVAIWIWTSSFSAIIWQKRGKIFLIKSWCTLVLIFSYISLFWMRTFDIFSTWIIKSVSIFFRYLFCSDFITLM